jgi:P-type E1-E2 ATPase
LKKVLFKLRVLANATPSHRALITLGLQKELGRVVAATGSGVADVAALHKADVSLALGSGCSAAKEVSDMVLTNDDY